MAPTEHGGWNWAGPALGSPKLNFERISFKDIKITEMAHQGNGPVEMSSHPSVQEGNIFLNNILEADFSVYGELPEWVRHCQMPPLLGFSAWVTVCLFPAAQQWPR